jgi:hypothetical protein
MKDKNAAKTKRGKHWQFSLCITRYYNGFIFIFLTIKQAGAASWEGRPVLIGTQLSIHERLENRHTVLH